MQLPFVSHGTHSIKTSTAHRPAPFIRVPHTMPLMDGFLVVLILNAAFLRVWYVSETRKLTRCLLPQGEE